MTQKSRAQILGRNLKRIRQEKGITRKQLADTIGITEISFGKYERGESLAPLDKIFEMADFLQVSVASLIGENDFSDEVPNVEKIIEESILNYRLKKAIEVLKTADFEITQNADDSFVVSFEMNFIKTMTDAFNFTVAPKKIELKFANVTDFLKVFEKAEKLQIGNYNVHRLKELFYRMSKGATDDELENIVILRTKD